MNTQLATNMNLPMPQISEFCQRWQIVEFALFGSVLRDDFRPDSDIDCLVSFQADSPWSLFDLVQMQIELEQMFIRNIDLISKSAIERSENWIRRQEILSTAQNILDTGLFRSIRGAENSESWKNSCDRCVEYRQKNPLLP